MLTEMSIQGCAMALCDSKKQDGAEPAKGTKTTVVHLMGCGTPNMEQGEKQARDAELSPEVQVRKVSKQYRWSCRHHG